MTRRRSPALMPGDVRTAFVNAHRDAPGKRRPTVLIRPEAIDGEPGWRVAALTSKSHYADGNPRIQVPFTVGLGSPGYLWGGRHLSLVPEHVIERGRIGLADRTLIQAIVDLYPHEVTTDDVVAMLCREDLAS